MKGVPYWRILAEILVESEKINPAQQAKRNVISRYKNITPRDDRVITKYFYQIMRYLGLLDKGFKELSKIEDINILDPYLRASIRITNYFILFTRPGKKKKKNILRQLSNLLVKKSNIYVKRFFRDYYKKLLEKKKEVKNSFKDYEKKYLISEWFFNKIKEIIPKDEIYKFLEKINETPKISIRVNLLKTNPDEIEEIFVKKYNKKVIRGKYLDYILKFEGPMNFDKVKEFREGKIIVQEEAAAMAVEFLNPKEGEVIVDMCAAPGGKTELICEKINLNGKVYAFDVDRIRIKKMIDLLKRTGTIDIVKIYNKDARLISKILGKEFADKILLDVPCTSSGTINKNPEVRWKLNDEKIKNSVKIQKELLNTAKEIVKPGGEILYCTCSIFKEENENLIKEFLKENEDFEIVDLSKFGIGHPGFLKGTIRTYIHKDDTICMFYAKLKKVS